MRLDGTDLATVTLADARRAVLVARHDAALFEGTLADNLLADEVVRRGHPGPGPGRRGGRRGPRLHARRPGHRDRRARAYVVRRSATAGRPGPRAGRRTDRAGAARPDHRHRRGDRGPDRRRPGPVPGPARGTLLVTSSPALLARCDRVVLVTDGTVTAEGTPRRAWSTTRRTARRCCHEHRKGDDALWTPAARERHTGARPVITAAERARPGDAAADRHRPPDLAGQRGPAPRAPRAAGRDPRQPCSRPGWRSCSCRPCSVGWSTS